MHRNRIGKRQSAKNIRCHIYKVSASKEKYCNFNRSHKMINLHECVRRGRFFDWKTNCIHIKRDSDLQIMWSCHLRMKEKWVFQFYPKKKMNFWCIQWNFKPLWNRKPIYLRRRKKVDIFLYFSLFCTLKLYWSFIYSSTGWILEDSGKQKFYFFISFPLWSVYLLTYILIKMQILKNIYNI